MSGKPLKVVMTPSHPGCFIRDEVIGELRLEKGFGVRMDLLVKMQAWHDVVRMR
ncbi:MAG: hypothetical protein OXI13_06965 [Gammaproteobacteria bacterium]|nr:hypothetical protein [Gammaproteobacteria bacterium]